MAVTIRVADLHHDRDGLIRFLSDNLSAQADADRFDWLYLNSPHGQARAWLAVDERGETIGIASAFPRHFLMSDKPVTVWVLGDFCIAQGHRTLGPAVSLQRSLLESLVAEEGTICYDFPSQSMMSIYKRLGIPTLGQQVRYVKVLRVDEKVQKYVRNRLLERPLTQIANWTLALGPLSRSMSQGVTFSMLEEEFGEEFSAIDTRSQSRHALRGLRTARHLNWRYVWHPQKSYYVITAKRQSELIGYAVVEAGGPHTTLADLRTTDPENTVPGFLAYIEQVARDMGAHSINASSFEDCCLVPYLRQAKFRARESSPVVAYGKHGTKPPADIHDSRNWFLLHGDRES